jgi:hypothetical protein
MLGHDGHWCQAILASNSRPGWICRFGYGMPRAKKVGELDLTLYLITGVLCVQGKLS